MKRLTVVVILLRIIVAQQTSSNPGQSSTLEVRSQVADAKREENQLNLKLQELQNRQRSLENQWSTARWQTCGPFFQCSQHEVQGYPIAFLSNEVIVERQMLIAALDSPRFAPMRAYAQEQFPSVDFNTVSTPQGNLVPKESGLRIFSLLSSFIEKNPLQSYNQPGSGNRQYSG